MPITLEPEIEAQVVRRAARRGMTPEEYLRATFRSKPKTKKAATEDGKPQTGAELAERLEAMGVIGGGYGDPNKTPQEIARELRQQAETRGTGRAA